MISVMNYKDNDISHGIVDTKSCLRASVER
jgi:hypothetical protein